jgi:hypothetical protein
MKDTKESREAEKAQMQALADAMTCYISQDECGDCVIQGKYGNIHVDGVGYCVAIMLNTVRQFTFAMKQVKPFCELRQQGDTEGAFHMCAIPSKAQCVLLREIIGVRKIMEFTPEVLASKRESMSRARQSLEEKGLSGSLARSNG